MSVANELLIYLNCYGPVEYLTERRVPRLVMASHTPV